MNKIFLITRPRYDHTTHYLFGWCEDIVNLAKKKGFQVLDLKKDRVNKKEVTSILFKKQPFFVFLNGHGDSDCVTGQGSKILLKAGENEQLLKSKIIYALSCRSAEKLGPESIKSGAVAYLGYNDDFVFFYDKEKFLRPLEDETAKFFLNPSSQIVKSLLKGHSTEEAHNRSKAMFVKNIQKILTSESSVENYLVPWLMWDWKHQVCLGDKKATLYENS